MDSYDKFIEKTLEGLDDVFKHVGDVDLPKVKQDYAIFISKFSNVKSHRIFPMSMKREYKKIELSATGLASEISVRGKSGDVYLLGCHYGPMAK